LVPRYFDPAAVTAVLSDIEETTELLKLPFDFNREPPTAKPDATKPGRERPARLEYWALEGRMGDDVIIDDPSDAHRDRGAGGRRFLRLRSFTHTTATKFHRERDILEEDHDHTPRHWRARRRTSGTGGRRQGHPPRP
jgi:hypothetical protein